MKPRTLGHRLALANALLILAVLALGVAAISGLMTLGHDIAIAVTEYEEVQILNRADVRLERVMAELALGGPDVTSILADIAASQQDARAIIDFHTNPRKGEPEENDEPGQTEHDVADATEVLSALGAAESALLAYASSQGSLPEVCKGLYAGLQRPRLLLSHMAGETDLSSVHRKAAHRARASVAAVSVLMGVIVILALVVSIRVHRRVAGSVRRLQLAVRRIACGRFAERVDERGDAEIVGLARDFNLMAVELESLYRTMESRVREKSRELVRSERLASVGFMAAGVAHEINNPLSIIGGYADLSRRWLSGKPTDVQLEESRAALAVIHDEAFRCKGIVEQLTTLCLSGSGPRQPVPLNGLVRELLSLVRGLESGRNRRLIFENESGGVEVSANSAELKQVVLNLIVNALAATDTSRGEIRVQVERVNGSARLTVSDNGRGLAPETLENVFEPFFSRRAATEKPGLGLGLFISHTIVKAHGGCLHAESDGVGKGCRFVVELPVLQNQETADAP